MTFKTPSPTGKFSWGVFIFQGLFLSETNQFKPIRRDNIVRIILDILFCSVEIRGIIRNFYLFSF